jgi:tetratricopeptide (TPR) repeat protein
MSEKKDESVLDIQETVSKAEQFIEDNKKSLGIILGAIVLIIGAYFGYKKLYIEPENEKAQQEMWMAERYFEQDSLLKAINGDGTNKGFEAIVDEYSSTPAGNLAHYYLGMCYLNVGRYDEAIDQLGSFDAKDDFMGPLAVAAIGDAHMEKGDSEKAIKYYLQAAGMHKNNLTSPIFLMKAGRTYESMSKYEDAIKVYEQLLAEYPDSKEGKDADKYLTYTKMKAGK